MAHEIYKDDIARIDAQRTRRMNKLYRTSEINGEWIIANIDTQGIIHHSDYLSERERAALLTPDILQDWATDEILDAATIPDAWTEIAIN